MSRSKVGCKSGFAYVISRGDLYKIRILHCQIRIREFERFLAVLVLKLSLRFYLYSQCYPGLEKELHES
jgi:hypothetical protein